MLGLIAEADLDLLKLDLTIRFSAMLALMVALMLGGLIISSTTILQVGRRGMRPRYAPGVTSAPTPDNVDALGAGRLLG